MIGAVVVSCEHGGNEIPSPFGGHLRIPGQTLRSHLGWDPGSLDYGRLIAKVLGAPCIENRVTRLLVDANRSDRSPRRLSRFARALPADLIARAIGEVWGAHRTAVAAAVEAFASPGGDAAAGPVLHLSCHSFTPSLDGKVRDVDIGLLYDPSREGERLFAKGYQRSLKAALPELRIRLNSPYRGTADGLTRTLRGRWPADRYLGLELEVSQRFPVDSSADGRVRWGQVQEKMVDCLREVLGR